MIGALCLASILKSDAVRFPGGRWCYWLMSPLTALAARRGSVRQARDFQLGNETLTVMTYV